MFITLNVCKYIFAGFVLLYGAFVAYEDIKTKEIHAFPIELTNMLMILLCLASQSTEMMKTIGITICILFALFIILERIHCFGSGDTKMYIQGIVFTLWWLRPQSLMATTLAVVSYMFIVSIAGLITALIKHDFYPPMAPAFLFANLTALCVSIFVF